MMEFNDFLQRYGKQLFKVLYPVVSGIVLAVMVSSYIYYRSYPLDVERVAFSPAQRQRPFNPNRAIADILNRNVMELRVTEQRAIKSKAGREKGAVLSSLKKARLLGIFLDGKPLAVLKSGDEILYLHPGDSLSNYRVSKVEFDRVVLEGPKGEYLLEFPEEKGGMVSSRPSTVKREEESQEEKVVVKRAEVLQKAKDLNKLLTTLRIAPYYRKDEFLGYRLAMIKKGSFLYKLGLRAGDVIKRVNGEDVSSPERLVEMLGKLDTVTAVTVDMLRGGEKKTIFIEIED